jgi:hypothetical protein
MGLGRSRAGVVVSSATAFLIAGCPGSPTTPTAAPSANPAGPAASASPISGAPASATPAPGATNATPTAIPSTPDTSSRATIQGTIFDSQGNRVDAATVVGKILGAGTFANGSDTLTVTTQLGSFALNGAPTGATVLVTVTKEGFATRQQTIVPLANLQGSPDQNRMNFGFEAGTTGDATYALSEGVEVFRTTPAPSATGIDPSEGFTLTFNGPVVTTDVEAAFAIYVAGVFGSTGVYGGSGDSYSLTAVDASGGQIALPYGYDMALDDGAADRTASQVMPEMGSHRLFDSTAFDATWTNNQTVTFRFKHGYHLPSDKDATRLPTYAMTLEGKPVRALGNTTGMPARFRISPAQGGRFGVTFKVAADVTPPRIVGVTGLNRSESAGSTPLDRIRVVYSEPMHLMPLSLNGAAIPGVGSSSSATWLSHYAYAVKSTLDGGVADVDLKTPTGGATATLDMADPSHRAILFAPDSDDPDTSGARGFSSGSTIWVKVGGGVTDPAGNPMDAASDAVLRSGRAI